MKTKKMVLFITLCCIGTFSIFAQAINRAQSALSQFEQTYSEYNGKAYLSEGAGGDRTWQEQMSFILERPQSYPNISQRFTQQFGLTLPASVRQMTSEMLGWWEREIMAQAGRSPGFPHIGGKAQDISVRNLDSKGKQLFSDIIRQHNGLEILYEKPPTYGVSMSEATVFHCYVP